MDSEKLQLEIRSVTKKYSAKTVLDRVSLKLEPGIYGLLGPNGAGKSTLMNIIVGVLPPSAGQVVYNGQEIGALGRKYRSILGYMPQQQLVCPNMSGAEFLSYMAALKDIPKKDRKNLIMWAASQVNMQDELGKKLNAYSGGMKQRILLASALLNNPTVLILDEPTAGLDPKGRDDILDQIAELHKVRGITIVLVSHSMEDIAKYVERLIVMNHGEAVFDDEPKKVFSHYKELETMGLAAPQITYIMHALKEHGLNVDADATTVEEARDSILAALKASDSPLLKEGGAEK